MEDKGIEFIIPEIERIRASIDRIHRELNDCVDRVSKAVEMVSKSDELAWKSRRDECKKCDQYLNPQCHCKPNFTQSEFERIV